jgi:hypothetical protein
MFRPLLLAHDVGQARDRSTAVVGGNSRIPPRLLGRPARTSARALRSPRASALAAAVRCCPLTPNGWLMQSLRSVFRVSDADSSMTIVGRSGHCIRRSGDNVAFALHKSGNLGRHVARRLLLTS